MAVYDPPWPPGTQVREDLLTGATILIVSYKTFRIKVECSYDIPEITAKQIAWRRWGELKRRNDTLAAVTARLKS